MDPKRPFLTTPVAVLIGSVIIAIAILISNGVITLKNSKAKASSETTLKPGTQEYAVSKLKEQANKAGLDQKKFESCLDSGEKADLVKKDLEAGSAAGVQGTPAVFINGHLISGSLPYEVFKRVIDFELKGGNWNNPDSTVKDLVDGVEDGSKGNFEVDKEAVLVETGNIPPQGDPNAKVTLVEFSDYQCPFCGRLYNGTILQLRKEYLDTGKAKLFYRDYPLPLHKGAQKAGEAARCAGDQGKYWQFHDVVFENQENIF